MSRKSKKSRFKRTTDLIYQREDRKLHLRINAVSDDDLEETTTPKIDSRTPISKKFDDTDTSDDISNKAAHHSEQILNPALGVGELTLQPIAISANTFFNESKTINLANQISASTIGLIGLIYAAQRSYLNYKYIIDANVYIADQIEDMSLQEVESMVKSLDKREVKTVSEEDEISMRQRAIEQIISNRMLGTITQNTISPGIAGSALMGSIFLFSAILFPPLAIPLAITGVSVLGAGAISIIGATITNRYWLNKKLKESFSRNTNIKNKIKLKAKDISKTIRDEKFTSARKSRNFAESFSSRMLDFISAIKLIRLINYASLTLNIVSSSMQNIALLLSAALDGASNYLSRREKLLKFSKISTESFIPKINVRKFFFFGKNKFEKFVEEYKNQIVKRLGLSPEIPLKQLCDKLKYENLELYKQLQSECVKLDILKSFNKFCTKQGLDQSADESFEKFVTSKIQSNVSSDIRLNGYIGSFSVILSLVSIGLIFPPALPAMLIISAAATVLTPIATEYLCYKEGKEFKEKALSLLREELSGDLSHESVAANIEAQNLLKDIKHVIFSAKMVDEQSSKKTIVKDSPKTEATPSLLVSKSKSISREETSVHSNPAKSLRKKRIRHHRKRIHQNPTERDPASSKTKADFASKEKDKRSYADVVAGRR